MKIPRLLCSDFLLDIIFPNFCPSCGRTVPWDEVFCEECEPKLEYIGEIPWQAVFPADIDGEPPSFDRAESLFLYEGTAKQAVLAFKDGSALKLAEHAAKRLVLKLDDCADEIDIVTAVPMHKKKQRNRGYNQAAVFAKAMAKELDAECELKLLGHRKSTRAQHKRMREERFKAAAETYYPLDKSRSLEGKTVLICDDIFTTGATINACASILKSLGAKKVIAVTICRTDSFGKIKNVPDKE